MKILLLGEYSGFFNSLKEGLVAIGHNVTLAGRKDGFKAYPVDISLEPVFFNKALPIFLRKLYHKITRKDIDVWEVYFLFRKHRESLKSFDVVFLINEQPITHHYYTEKKILSFIFRNNKKVFLSACGDDVIYIDFLLNKLDISHNILSPYIQNKTLKKHYKYALEYTSQDSKKIHDFVFENIANVIPADYDYVMAYENHPKALPLIPFPVRLYQLAYQQPIIEDKIIIFHGINQINYLKKGNNHFEEALSLIKEKYEDKISIITAISLPYAEYINKYNQCHILLDQAYAYDQGYNALEAMAKGKVVFTGASEKWRLHYGLQENSVAIHATPNGKEIADKLEWLILNPEKILEISKNAREFIEKEHDYKMVAERYVQHWTNN